MYNTTIYSLLSDNEKYLRKFKLEKEHELKLARDQNERQRSIARDRKLQEWFERKEKEAADRLEQLRLQQQEEVPKPTDPNESMRNYNAWLEKKSCYEKALRQREREEAEQRAQLEEVRRQQAAEQFEIWLESAPQRPKPVPLNKGIYSLRGTISNLYVNPQPWVFDSNHIADDGSLL